jgi:hypothetical protein
MRQDDPVLLSIAVTKAPAKTVYAQGETLDITGLVVTGTYSDDTTRAEIVVLPNIRGYNAGTTGRQPLTVTINGKTAIFTVTITAGSPGGDNPVLQSTAITSLLAKFVYARGETLDISGLAVTGTYPDGTTRAETVSLSNISGYDPNTQGTQTLTVTAAVLQSIAVTNGPTKTTDARGEALNISGLVVTGTYTDGAKRPETVSLSNISGYNANIVGTQLLTVTVDGKTATFTVTVNPGDFAW